MTNNKSVNLMLKISINLAINNLLINYRINSIISGKFVQYDFTHKTQCIFKIIFIPQLN